MSDPVSISHERLEPPEAEERATLAGSWPCSTEGSVPTVCMPVESGLYGCIVYRAFPEDSDEDREIRSGRISPRTLSPAGSTSRPRWDYVSEKESVRVRDSLETRDTRVTALCRGDFGLFQVGPLPEDYTPRFVNHEVTTIYAYFRLTTAMLTVT